ncbi:hypothetical protein K437DRAFT_270213 [Tilletiaria anomala UBC 951]|uniref:Thioesterase/thiol ester dehydrase-isomerase n=1 Tax=Tilletiaria anomala (strain ATCC 24038 / CBS 436.72 / UBC 951) TaxID=1037660 RepID=A0A066VM58_TILAU|nr:uncharacterized protein K437DRAFT_270213 [Tilletiaria anomala UBC 951]KDN39685.1 hypothetical protein K437DRAFT_270213 [Tilletiaria anomala UBC 951]
MPGTPSKRSPAQPALVSRQQETSMLSPLHARDDSYAERRAALVNKMIARGLIPESLIELPVLFGHIDLFGHVTGPKWFEFAHTCVDRLGSHIYPPVLGEAGVRGLLTGRGPITVLPLSINARFRLPVGWPDAVLLGGRPAYIDPQGKTYGETYEAFSLKTGELAFIADYHHVHIDLTQGGKAVSFPDLIKQEPKWDAWVRDWQQKVASGKQKLKAFQEEEKKATGQAARNAEVEQLKHLGAKL